MKDIYFLYEDSEDCTDYQGALDYMKENNLLEMGVFIAVKEKVSGYFFCQDVGEVSEEGHCGKSCPGYAPRNGKFGICKHKASTYTPGKKVKITA